MQRKKANCLLSMTVCAYFDQKLYPSKERKNQKSVNQSELNSTKMKFLD